MLYVVLLMLAVVVIAGLSVYAFTLIRKVKAQEAKREEEERLLAQKNAEQNQYRNRSIQALAQGLLGDQLSLTEGAIRIRVMLDGLEVDASVQEEFKAFYHLSDATRHIPILEEWKKLKLKQRMAFDKERQQLEADHKEFVEDAARRILGREF
jgi:Tfp pilus assembly protein PilO